MSMFDQLRGIRDDGYGFTTLTETLTSPERATLTLTHLGPVLGCPAGTDDADRERVRQIVDVWRKDPDVAVLVLPWPVDVTDLTR